MGTFLCNRFFIFHFLKELSVVFFLTFLMFFSEFSPKIKKRKKHLTISKAIIKLMVTIASLYPLEFRKFIIFMFRVLSLYWENLRIGFLSKIGKSWYFLSWALGDELCREKRKCRDMMQTYGFISTIGYGWWTELQSSHFLT